MNNNDKIKFITTMIDMNDSSITDYILNSIISNGIDYTSNKNGVFINLSVLDDDILDYIYNLIITHNYTNKNSSVLTNKVCNKELNPKNMTMEHKKKDSIPMKPIDVILLSLSKQSLTI